MYTIINIPNIAPGVETDINTNNNLEICINMVQFNYLLKINIR